MKKNETYYGAYGLYILRPSKIIDIEEEISTVKSDLLSHEVEVIEQDIMFRTIPNQIVIAEKSAHNKNLYIPLVEEIPADELPFEQYYNQVILEKQGLSKNQGTAGFVGLFSNDTISLLDLPDFEFIQNLGKIGPIKHLKYFNYKNELKSKYHKKISKIQYTKEELQRLKEYIIENVFPKDEKEKIITKNYTTVKEPFRDIMNR